MCKVTLTIKVTQQSELWNLGRIREFHLTCYLLDPLLLTQTPPGQEEQRGAQGDGKGAEGDREGDYSLPVLC